MEIWRNIKNYEELYEVSNQGNVRSKDRMDASGHKRKGILRKQNKDKDGYYTIVLCKDGKVKSYKVHRLVAEAFIENPYNKPEIDHINTDREDNRVENLKWVTSKENSNNPYSINNYKKGQRNRFNVCS